MIVFWDSPHLRVGMPHNSKPPRGVRWATNTQKYLADLRNGDFSEKVDRKYEKK